jgi:hypothetical protein
MQYITIRDISFGDGSVTSLSKIFNYSHKQEALSLCRLQGVTVFWEEENSR